MSIKLSIVIVNYNVRYFLEQVLISVEKAIENIEAEVFVVDNDSKDHSVEMVYKKFPKVKVIANKVNTGFSVANNQAILESKGEYVLLLNPDTVVEEDTFERCIAFMDAHQKAGGLGVKMIDGQGNFLPESKRALPTAKVAFFKAFGLSALFPKSKLFAQYHLGYLSENETHEVDILAGAFMFMRKSVLDEIGLLDETFFMYGEDIDLSYRIIKAGYKNYYFPDTKIIHYKGESTKKGSLNYVKVFYEAMLIFARKHFSSKQAKLYSIAIYFAIFIKGALTLVSNFLQKALMPLLDFGLAFLGLILVKDFWATKVKTTIDFYPEEFTYYVLPGYVFIWLLSSYFAGAYDKPFRTKKIFRALAFGTLIIAAVYGFLPEELRFSRAIILLGAVSTFLVMLLNRFIYNILKHKKASFEIEEKKNVVIIGNEQESQRVLTLLKQTSDQTNFVGFVGVNEKEKHNELIGELSQIEDIASLYDVNELIFCAKDISAKEVISLMTKFEHKFSYKIVPPESLSIIGSDSKNTSGDLYALDVNLTIDTPRARQTKRIFDILMSILLFLSLPISIWFIQNKTGVFSNIYNVFFGKKTWIGYIENKSNEYNLPKIKKGVLNALLASGINENESLNKDRINLNYAKNYAVEKDFIYFFKAFKKLGNV
ncbi:MAG: glycosyltransferase [Chitinophagales bacterium]